MICNLQSAWKGVNVETCRVWYSTLLAQVSRAQPVKLYYLSHESSSCAAIPYYGNASAPYGVSDSPSM